jgi:hypothetical protein
MSQRQYLDRLSRAARLNQTHDRPLGLLEDLEEKGLLEGGTHSTMLAGIHLHRPERRAHEMRKRSSRLRSRQDEPIPADHSLDHIFSMIRAIAARGFNLEKYYIHYGDTGLCGLMSRKTYLAMLNNLLPLSTRDQQLLLYRYSSPAGVDSLGVFRDSQVALRITGMSSADSNTNSAASSVLQTTRQLLQTTGDKLRKSPNQMYRVFASYDRVGTGLVTTIQV